MEQSDFNLLRNAVDTSVSGIRNAIQELRTGQIPDLTDISINCHRIRTQVDANRLTSNLIVPKTFSPKIRELLELRKIELTNTKPLHQMELYESGYLSQVSNEYHSIIKEFIRDEKGKK